LKILISVKNVFNVYVRMSTISLAFKIPVDAFAAAINIILDPDPADLLPLPQVAAVFPS